jgi:hypothetical protein
MTTPNDTPEPSLASAGSVGEVLAKGIADIIRIAAERDWIPVTERLPGDESQYIVWHKRSGDCRIAFRYEGHWYEGSILITANVTHWMPLPASPLPPPPPF